MKVSVVISVHDADATLAWSLEVLLVQTFRDFEIICVDDGSSDGLLALLQDMSVKMSGDRSRFKIIHQDNAGTFLARRRGVAAAHGEYACFIDPDDWMKPQFLEKLVKAAERGRWDIVQCGVELEKTHERTAKQRAVSERYCNPDAPTIRGGGILTCAYIHKRIGWNLIFCLFRASLVKEAFAELPDVNMRNETDETAFSPIARRVRSFRRIRDRLYVYRYGDVISTRTDYALEDYRRTLGKFDFVRRFAPNIRTAEEEASLLAEIFLAEPKKVSHVGIHYFNLKFGGVQRVLLQNDELLRSLGLFLEEPPDEDCFPMPKGIDIRILPRPLVESDLTRLSACTANID